MGIEPMMNYLEYLIPALFFLAALSLLMQSRLKKIRNVIKHREHLKRRVKEMDLYNKNLIAFIELAAHRDTCKLIRQAVEGEIVLFGYNSIARYLIEEFSKGGITINYVIENNPVVRTAENRKGNRYELIASEDILQRCPGGAGIIICLLHHNAYGIAGELSAFCKGKVRIHLLEEIIRCQRRK